MARRQGVLASTTTSALEQGDALPETTYFVDLAIFSVDEEETAAIRVVLSVTTMVTVATARSAWAVHAWLGPKTETITITTILRATTLPHPFKLDSQSGLESGPSGGRTEPEPETKS